MATIIQTIEQFTAAVPTAAGHENFDDFAPYVSSAELWIKRNVLGAAMYTTVCEMPDESSPDYTLLELCRNVVANHAYWDAIPFLDVIHTEAGFGVIQSNNKAPASKERIERLRSQCIARRDQEIESLLLYLEENQIYWNDWKGDEVFSNMYNSLIPTLDIFRKYHHIADRATLDKLRGAIVTVQNTWVADVISKEYVDELVEAQKDDDFTIYDDNIIEMLRDAICKLSLAWGIDSMSVIVGPNGVVQLAGQDNYVGAIGTDSRLSLYKTTFKKAGDAMLAKVRDYMVKNIEDYTTYAASSEYAALIDTGFENEEENEIFTSLF